MMDIAQREPREHTHKEKHNNNNKGGLHLWNYDVNTITVPDGERKAGPGRAKVMFRNLIIVPERFIKQMPVTCKAFAHRQSPWNAGGCCLWEKHATCSHSLNKVV